MLTEKQMDCPDASLLSVCIGTASVYGDGMETRYRTLTVAVSPAVLSLDFTMALWSQSFGEYRRLTMDLDLLYANIEDELNMDVDNHYGLRG
ncbi:hypothetical protein DFH06DRAFT_1321067 [Mycena polygramma]|nr:hypothetical protein DFH06DRAFT_1321067 [Mycena polygramma]